MNAALQGFAIGLSLILAIGAQNAFVLRQGLRRAHVFSVVAVCALSDAALIGAGVAGFAAILELAPWFATVARLGGAAFLVVYGALSLRSALRGTGALEAAEEGTGSRLRAIGVCLALTWLNPHVYLDTVVLLGSVSARFEGQRLEFALGAMSASLVFFTSLGYGARLLAPLFARPSAWRVLDLLVAAVMWAIAAGLLFGH
ncbi:LysE/ArgO family amino acid transporter [Tropicimonas sp. IMCC34011]|uniref:LysE/ArgO family amino acid transporter n=1 Tax=Tropicimonas sp. IMCC34011 TaxID=2248759 RepID=UPI000E23A55B|nr:LysE/ArgO family amino acid transporter [Tropicimonas sp. IMCC34011]